MSDWDGITFDGLGRLVDPTAPADAGPPPDLTWSPLELLTLTAPTLMGVLVTHRSGSGQENNLVAVSEPFTDSQGTWVRVVTYLDYTRWTQQPASRRPANPRPARALPLGELWVMHEARTGHGSGSGAAGGSGRATGPLPRS